MTTSPGILPTPRRSSSRAAAVPSTSAGFGLHVDYPEPGSAVVVVRGVVDDASLARFDELLGHRLASLIDVLVVDLSTVDFISVSGLDLLCDVFTKACARGISARFVVATHAVHRALQVSGLLETLSCHADVTKALATSVFHKP